MRNLLKPLLFILSLIITLSCNYADPNSDLREVQNIQVIELYVKELWNMRNLSLLDSIIGEDFVDPASTSGKKGPEDLREVISGYLSVYPDLTIKLEDLVADHHKVAWKYSATGTNKNTGEKVTFSGIIIDDIEQGKIVNRVGVWMRSISDLTSSSPHSVSR